MKISHKITLIVGVAMVAAGLLTGLGWYSLRDMAGRTDDVVNDHCLGLIENELTPLLQSEVLPLINEELVRLHSRQESIALMLEADRDLHQAVLVEKLALAAAEESEFEAARKVSEENIEQAESRMRQAIELGQLAGIPQAQAFNEAFAKWKDATRKVFDLAHTPGKIHFARKASTEGSAAKTFAAARALIDELQQAQQQEIDKDLADVHRKEQSINQREKRIAASREHALSELATLDRIAMQRILIFVAIGLVCVGAALTVGIATARSITRPLRRTVAILRDIAQGEGDLTRRLDVRGRDELSALASSFNEFVAKLETIVRDVAADAEQLAGASSQLSSIASQLSSGAEQTGDQSTMAATSAEQLTAAMEVVAGSSSEMSSNVKSVAAAVEQMTASIAEVARGAARAASVADSTAKLTEVSNAQIGELGQAASQIGRVIDVIQEIAEQTNLLALNATIEAARAGESGKGFAVVATEVKELARQTAGATEEIRSRINGIQASMAEAVGSIGRISEAVVQVNEVSQSIATAVEEQSIVTKEIAGQVSNTSAAAESVACGVARSAETSSEISRSISQVDRAARETAQGASQTDASSRDLLQLAQRLRMAVGGFKTSTATPT